MTKDKNLSPIEQRVLLYLVNTLYARTKSATLFLVITCAVYLALQAGQFPRQALLAWYAVLLLVLLGRLLLTRAYNRRRATSNHDLETWLHRFRWGILATGITLGSLNIFFFPRHSLPHQMLAFLFPMGLTAGILTMMPDFFSFAIYACTLLLPDAYAAFALGDWLHTGIGALILILLVFFVKFNRDYSGNFISARKLLYENESLVKDLEKEKNKLINRLGRILNDSSNEIYVADAQSLQIIQVNQGAIQNLGYGADEFSAINLLTIFCDLDQETWEELIAPLRSNEQESVHYKGRNRRKNGTVYPIDATIQLSSQDSPPIIVATVKDITERHKWEQKLIYQANYDQLTGLLNRHYMQSYINSAFIRARRNRKKLALMFMDLDNFKNINDSLGHDVGDEVLKQTADRIRSLLRGSDTPIRSGGDEFMVLLEGLQDSNHANVVARKLVNLFQEPFIINMQEIYMTVSIGISIYPDDSELMEQLLQYADMAMYHAKEAGKNNYRFFSREMSKISDEKMLIAGHLRRAIENGELSLVFQPQVDIRKRTIVGAEALLRWHNLQLGNVPPDKFIKIAEEIGFIEEIGNWVLKEACREAKTWQEVSAGECYVAVNISSQQFRTGTLMAGIDQALNSSGLDNRLLELEITESLLLQYEHNINTIDALHHRGLRLALDDFGTGYSSLSYLKRFPLQVLKIDRSFTRELEEDDSDRALVQAIIAMAQSLRLDIVAEGIETRQQLEFLRQCGVQVVQGYLFSPPVPPAEFKQLLRDESRIWQKIQPERRAAAGGR
ncbi:MAG: EAL domain-containing protein [Deltaproteobacteria bacterium]|nr:EAL domain-containing protein [Deltaproteobacteria bacterium]